MRLHGKLAGFRAARKVVVEGITFDSLGESRRYLELRTLERAGDIRALRVHTRWPCAVNGVHVATYISDFDYFDTHTKAHIVEDVKGNARYQDDASRVRRRLAEAVHGLVVKVVERPAASGKRRRRKKAS